MTLCICPKPERQKLPSLPNISARLVRYNSRSTDAKDVHRFGKKYVLHTFLYRAPADQFVLPTFLLLVVILWISSALEPCNDSWSRMLNPSTSRLNLALGPCAPNTRRGHTPFNYSLITSSFFTYMHSMFRPSIGSASYCWHPPMVPDQMHLCWTSELCFVFHVYDSELQSWPLQRFVQRESTTWLLGINP